jgi:hypothetical protein
MKIKSILKVASPVTILIVILFDGVTRIALNYDGVYKFFVGLAIVENNQFSLKTYLTDTPFSYTSRNVVEFLKAVPLEVLWKLGIRDFFFLSFVWSTWLSLINWALVSLAVFFLWQQTNSRIAYNFIFPFAMFGLPLTSYLDSTLIIAVSSLIIFGVLIFQDKWSMKSKTLLTFLSISFVSTHEIVLPVMLIFLCGILANTKKSFADNRLLLLAKISLCVPGIFFTGTNYWNNRGAYSTTKSAVVPDFLTDISVKGIPILVMYGIFLFFLTVNTNSKSIKSRNELRFMTLAFFLMTPFHYLSLTSIENVYSYGYENRASFSFTILVAFVYFTFTQSIQPRISERLPKFHDYTLLVSPPNLAYVCIFSLIVTLSSHLNTDLKWKDCWQANINTLQQTENKAGLVLLSEIDNGCLKSSWTATMMGITMGNNSAPSSFLVEQDNLDPENKNGKRLYIDRDSVALPFDLRVPKMLPGLDLTGVSKVGEQP